MDRFGFQIDGPHLPEGGKCSAWAAVVALDTHAEVDTLCLGVGSTDIGKDGPEYPQVGTESRLTRWARALTMAGLGLLLVGVGSSVAEVSSDRPAAVLLLPKLRFDSSIGVDTLVRLSNTSTTSPLTLHCLLVDASPLCPNDPGATCLTDSAFRQCTVPCTPRWSETDFRIVLTTRQPIGWRISQGMRDCGSNPVSDPDRPCFQLDGVTRTGPGNQNNAGSRILPTPHDQFVGYLQCIAVDDTDAPVERNDLKGEATIVRAEHLITPAPTVCTSGAPTTTGVNCTSDATCTSTGECDTTNKVCKNGFHACTQDSDCGKCVDQGQQCTAGVVGAPCAGNADCDADFGTCMVQLDMSMKCFNNTSLPCTTAMDCKVAGACGVSMAQVCSAGTVGFTCVQDATCGAGGGQCNGTTCVTGALGKACSTTGADPTCNLPGKCGVTAPTVTTTVDVDGYNGVGLQAIAGKNNHDNTLCLGGCVPGTPGCQANDRCPMGPEYDGCANILMLDHFFDGAIDPISGEPVITDLTLVPCTQDYLRQNPQLTTVQFLVFNEFEQRFSTSTPVTCFRELQLASIDTRTSVDYPRSIFSAAVNGTLTGQTRIRGVVGNDPSHGDTLIGIAREVRCTTNSTVSNCVPVSTAAFNLHSQGRRSQADLIYLPGS